MMVSHDQNCESMNDNELKAFEHDAQKALTEHLDKKAGIIKRRASAAPSHFQGYRVSLAVRNKPLSQDTLFVHDSSASSAVEAEIEARRLAHASGWRVIGHLHDIIRRYRE